MSTRLSSKADTGCGGDASKSFRSIRRADTQSPTGLTAPYLNDKLELLEEALEELQIYQCDYLHFLTEAGDSSFSDFRHHLTLITGALLIPL